MLLTGFLPAGAARNFGSVIASLVGIVTLIKVFGVYIDTHEIGYRHNKGAIVVTRKHWALRRHGMVRVPVRVTVSPYFRTYTKGWYFKIPVFYDIAVGTKAHETRKIDPFEVDDAEGVQYIVRPSVTYRTRPNAKDLYRSREYSQNIDTTVVEIVEAAISRVVSASPLAKPTIAELTSFVDNECSYALRKYGQELVRVDMPLPARSAAQKTSEGLGSLVALLEQERTTSRV